MGKVLVNETSLSGIGNAIRSKNGTTTTYKPSEMAAAISAIKTGGGDLPEEAFNITGNCSYRFCNGGWDWFIESYRDKIVTKDITKCDYMFYNDKRENIPFEINCKNNNQTDISSMFEYCYYLKEVPKIKQCEIGNMDRLFRCCYMIRELPSDFTEWFDWSRAESSTSGFYFRSNNLFDSCYSLRSIPSSIFEHLNPIMTFGTYMIFYSGFNYCTSLDELTDIPIPYTKAITSNIFSNTFERCYRLKNFTFRTPNEQPYTLSWKGQTIGLNAYVGYVGSTSNTSMILNYNSGITADKQVTDDATYQALKDNPDWFTVDVAYSRYNHDSAVATINSLPDTSAYLAANGGTNTIKFLGASGSATDGGAINTLTEEEIAVATAKGWTVTLV